MFSSDSGTIHIWLFWEILYYFEMILWHYCSYLGPIQLGKTAFFVSIFIYLQIYFRKFPTFPNPTSSSMKWVQNEPFKIPLNTYSRRNEQNFGLFGPLTSCRVKIGDSS